VRRRFSLGKTTYFANHFLNAWILLILYKQKLRQFRKNPTRKTARIRTPEGICGEFFLLFPLFLGRRSNFKEIHL